MQNSIEKPTVPVLINKDGIFLGKFNGRTDLPVIILDFWGKPDKEISFGNIRKVILSSNEKLAAIEIPSGNLKAITFDFAVDLNTGSGDLVPVTVDDREIGIDSCAWKTVLNTETNSFINELHCGYMRNSKILMAGETLGMLIIIVLLGSAILRMLSGKAEKINDMPPH